MSNPFDTVANAADHGLARQQTAANYRNRAAEKRASDAAVDYLHDLMLDKAAKEGKSEVQVMGAVDGWIARHNTAGEVRQHIARLKGEGFTGSRYRKADGSKFDQREWDRMKQEMAAREAEQERAAEQAKFEWKQAVENVPPVRLARIREAARTEDQVDRMRYNRRMFQERGGI
jgi:hypothetical protein